MPVERSVMPRNLAFAVAAAHARQELGFPNYEEPVDELSSTAFDQAQNIVNAHSGNPEPLFARRGRNLDRYMVKETPFTPFLKDVLGKETAFKLTHFLGTVRGASTDPRIEIRIKVSQERSVPGEIEGYMLYAIEKGRILDWRGGEIRDDQLKREVPQWLTFIEENLPPAEASAANPQGRSTD